MYTSTKGEMPGAGEMPTLVHINGVPMWRDAASGRTFPLVAGAEDPPPADPNTEDKDADTSTDEKWDENRAKQAFGALREKEREREKAGRAQAKELAEIKAKLKQHEDAKLSETERLQARLEELEKAKAEHVRERQTWRDERALGDAARKLNARNPAVVVKLADASKLEHNAEGEPTNAEDLVKALLKDEPYLVGSAASGSGVPASPRANGQPQGHEDRVKENREKLRASGGYEPL